MQNFTFNKEGFNNLFPFYLLLDGTLTVTSLGKSIAKLYPDLTEGANFTTLFRIKRPFLDTITPAALLTNLSQLAILESRTGSDVLLRGQFEQMGDGFLFVGSPWFVSIEEIKQKNLSIVDFANYDPLLDLLQLIKTQQITTLELGNLLKINTNQREELRKDREELNRIAMVASANNNGIVFTTPEARIFWCNDAYIRQTGFSRDEIFGKTPVQIGNNPAIDKDALHTMIDRFYNGEAFDVELTHGRKDGSYFWTRIQGQPVYGEDGKVLQYFAMIEDMSEIREKEEELKLLSVITEKNTNSIVVCDKDGHIEWVNKSFEKTTGYSITELIGKKPGKLLQGPETNRETAAYLSGQIRAGEPFKCEILNYSKTGAKYWAQIQGQALYNERGDITRYFAIEEDITERKELEQQKEELVASLEKSNKELEDYAQIVSHDLKSPLRSINSLIAWIKEENEGGLSEQTALYFSMIENKLEKMDSLIQGVLTYSRIDKADVNKERINLHEIVRNIISIIHIPDNITVQVDGTLPTILADRYRMHQLFQNLIGNAVNYIDKPQGLVNIGFSETPAHYTFYVKDNGPGIAPENHEKIFKIFQSLIKNERSTGLGLSIVKKIADNYKGRVWLESELKKGTTFFIQLPKN